MRLSCNGCRVLRRGCNPECPIRTCLHWIHSPDSQSNATLFLAKFYGRAGLLNLLSAAPPHLQPAVFKSLLYEACGRIVNPVLGSTGLLSTGRWQLCEAAVKAVLSGAPIEQLAEEAPFHSALDGAVQQLQACDIRHVARNGKSCGPDRLRRGRTRMKRRASGKLKPECSRKKVEGGSVSGDSAGSRVSEQRSSVANSNSSSVDEELELELTLGWGPLKASGSYTIGSRD